MSCFDTHKLVGSTCMIANEIDYFLTPFYDTESDWTFSIKITLLEILELPEETKTDIKSTMINNYQQLFEVRKKTENGTNLLFRVDEAHFVNEFIMRFNSSESETASQAEIKYTLELASFSKIINPSQNTTEFKINILKQKESTVEVQIYQTKAEKYLTDTMVEVSKFSSTANDASISASSALAVAASFISIDSEGSLLRLGQFLTMVEKVKLIGAFLGTLLEEFINQLGEQEEAPQEETVASGQQGRRRVIEVDNKITKRARISRESTGRKNKLDRFNISIFIEKTYLLKLILYFVSWCFKLIGVMILAHMRKIQEVKKWKINFLKFQRKIHFLVTMSSVMDFYFFGTRVMLHRRNEDGGLRAKIICAVSLILLTMDMIEVIFISLQLEHKTDEKNNLDDEKKSQIQIARLNHQIRAQKI